MVYSNYIDNLLLRVPELKSVVFEIRDSPMFDFLNSNFQFCQSVLNDKRFFDLPNSFIYYSNRFSKNGRAKKIKNTSVIALNIGLLKSIKNTFSDNQKLNSFVNQRFTSTTTRKMVKYEIVPWIVLKFSFYHEYAHLIQDSKYLESTINSNNPKNELYNEDRHILEIDADIFAAFSLATHLIMEFGLDSKSMLETEEIVELTVLTSSIVFACLNIFESNNLDLYIKEYTHPHPIIRNFAIQNSILDYFEMYYSKYGVLEFINREELNSICLQYSLEITKLIKGIDVINKLSKAYQSNLEMIVNHYNFLITRNRKSIYSAVNKRAKVAKAVNNFK